MDTAWISAPRMRKKTPAMKKAGTKSMSGFPRSAVVKAITTRMREAMRYHAATSDRQRPNARAVPLERAARASGSTELDGSTELQTWLGGWAADAAAAAPAWAEGSPAALELPALH